MAGLVQLERWSCFGLTRVEAVLVRGSASRSRSSLIKPCASRVIQALSPFGCGCGCGCGWACFQLGMLPTPGFPNSGNNPRSLLQLNLSEHLTTNDRFLPLVGCLATFANAFRSFIRTWKTGWAAL